MHLWMREWKKEVADLNKFTYLHSFMHLVEAKEQRCRGAATWRKRRRVSGGRRSRSGSAAARTGPSDGSVAAGDDNAAGALVPLVGPLL
jgi:hypothetical protein